VIYYTDVLTSVREDMLQGFFVGLPRRPTAGQRASAWPARPVRCCAIRPRWTAARPPVPDTWAGEQATFAPTTMRIGQALESPASSTGRDHPRSARGLASHPKVVGLREFDANLQEIDAEFQALVA
jgi:hypothetical protein